MADLRYPSLYQINSRVCLTELSQKLGYWGDTLFPNWTDSS